MNFEHEYQSLFTAPDPAGTKRKAIDSPYLHRRQRRHFLLFDVAPFFGTLTAFASIPVIGFGWAEAGVLLVMWLITGFGISVGYHRLLAHRSFKTSEAVKAAFAVAGSMAGQGGVISWVAMHRRHHECADKEGDVHSPQLHGAGFAGRFRGFVHAHFTWMAAHAYPNVAHYAPDVLQSKRLVWISRNYYPIAFAGFIVPAMACAAITQSLTGLLTGVLWGGMVRMFVLEQGIWSLNSFCHLWGRRDFSTRDHSRNIGWLAPFIFGESWHHNHHAFPGSAFFALRWYRIDPGYWLIVLMKLAGLARDVKVPRRDQIDIRMTRTTARHDRI
ncbi:fatty acid desaturase [Variovorax paradoxus]|nr:fatty acid desaturase [Variovorax paradoxus]